MAEQPLMAETTPKKRKLWFDPKNPPKTPIYVGQKIPIYVVPDDTQEDDRLVEPTWRKTDWYFRIVAIRRAMIQHEDGGLVEGEVVDVEWPNKHIDEGVPINNMYGHFTRLKESWVPKFTEEYHSDDEEEESDPQTNEEKLQKLLKILKFLSDNKDKLINTNEPKVVAEETTEDPTVLHVDSDNVEVEELLVDIEQPPQTAVAKKAAKRAKKKADKKAAKKAAKKKTLDGSVTAETIENWFKPPSRGGLRIKELRGKASELGITEPHHLKKDALKEAMLAIVQN